MLVIIKAITDEINKETLIAPNPKPSHLPTKKLMINKMMLTIIKTAGNPYCKEEFLFLNIKEMPKIITVRIIVSIQNDIFLASLKEMIKNPNE